MIPELGHYCLIIALAVSIIQAIIPGLGVIKHRPDWMSIAIPAALIQFVLVLMAYSILTYSFVTHDFSVLYVANTSNSTLPLIYRLSGVWGAHEGSLLLWILILCCWTASLALINKRYPIEVTAGVLSILGFISIGFLLFSLFTSNPFLRHFPPPVDGADLNPLLQDPVMAIHPPMLYMGYVGFAVPFAFAITALVQNKVDNTWSQWVRPWTIFAWVCLTAGITLGSWWAYYELGWGGWWFWDPVENASFMPWLTGTALIHSLAATEKRHIFKNWTVLLTIITFSLSLLGTFLVRSGVLTSVHAFAADPTRGVFILAFLGLVIGFSLGLFAYRAWSLRTISPVNFLSKEMVLLINSVFLLIAMLTILIGTIYPLILESLGGGKISVGPPYFNSVFIPLMIPIIVLLGVGPFMYWSNHSRTNLIQSLKKPLVYTIILASVFFIIFNYEFNIIGWCSITLAFWIIVNCCMKLMVRLLPVKSAGTVSRSWISMIVAHIGVSFTVIGIALSSIYGQEHDFYMKPGDVKTLAEYDFHFVEIINKNGANYQAQTGVFKVFKHERELTTQYPEKRFYNVRKNVMTEAAIESNALRDLYISLGQQLDINENAWSVRIYYKPFIIWIWLGGLVMVIGGLLAISDSRNKKRVKEDQVYYEPAVSNA